MNAPSIPPTVQALVTSADLGPVTVQEIPFGSRENVKHLDPSAVVVSTMAVGLNPTDYKHAHSDWSAHKEVIVGTDSAGVVLQVGSAVTHIKQGDRVAGMVYGCSTKEQGACAQGIVYDAANAFAMPAGMSFLEGAVFTATHLTVVQAFYMRWQLAPPSSPDSSEVKKILLVWGGSTAVGGHAIQLANLSGYRVFATASPDAHDRLRSLGASECFDYRDPSVLEQIRKAAGQQGVFAAYDTAGINGSTDVCIDAMGPQGGRVMSTLPFGDETASRRADVKVGFESVYTVVGYPFTFANAFAFPAMPKDREASLAWMANELPPLLDGWIEGQGSPKYQPHKLRVMPGGLESVHEGLQVLGSGSYKAEKLVYNLA